MMKSMAALAAANFSDGQRGGGRDGLGSPRSGTQHFLLRETDFNQSTSVVVAEGPDRCQGHRRRHLGHPRPVRVPAGQPDHRPPANVDRGQLQPQDPARRDSRKRAQSRSSGGPASTTTSPATAPTRSTSSSWAATRTTPRGSCSRSGPRGRSPSTTTTDRRRLLS